MNETEEHVIAGEGQVVVVHLGAEAYGIAIENIHTVIVLQEITRAPQTPPWVRGLMNLRGQVLPVIDLRKRFELANAEDGPKTRVVIVNADGVSAGLVVDEVSEVLTLTADQLEAPTMLMQCKARDCITAIGKAASLGSADGSKGEKLVLVLDVAKVVGSALQEEPKAQKGKRKAA